MNLKRMLYQIFLQILFVIVMLSTLQAKSIEKFEKGNNISDYFSGIILLNDNQHDLSYKYFKKLEGLEDHHIKFSSKYLFSLVNLGKFKEAFEYSKKLEKKDLSNYESDLIIGTYYLKNENYDLASKYFLKLKNRKSQFVLNNFVANSLLNWVSFNNLSIHNSEKKIDKINSQFKNLKKIQKVFLHCFKNSENTDLLFNNLILNESIDFSRYNYFYANYLINNNRSKKAEKILLSSIKEYPRNLLLNQMLFDIQYKKVKTNFDCRSISNVIGEIFYITANALSSQYVYTFSNFYLNLAKYLNDDFYAFNTLLAENYYNLDNYEKALKIYKQIEKKGEIFNWYAAKQIATINLELDNNSLALNKLDKAYKKLKKKGLYEKYDYAKFLKNNNQFDKSIKLYSEIISSVTKSHPLYPKLKDGRGVSYERIGEWKKAEKDLLASLDSVPDQAYVLNYLAYSWIEKGININRSLKMLKKANELKSNDPYIIDSLGWALFKLKKYEESQNYLQSAVQLMPADPVINDHYGDVLWMNNKRVQARYYWKFVLNLEETEESLKNNIKIKLINGL